jgi:hypothetical protein
LQNKEFPGKEACTWISRGDVNSPVITPWNGALSPDGLKYVLDTSVRPPALGVTVVNQNSGDGCLPAFTRLQFGITTNEIAKCKIDYNLTSGFDEMTYYFGDSASAYNHTQEMRLPGPDIFTANGSASPIFKNDGTTRLYVRCQDANGNYNVDAYSISYCVDKSPDTTAPKIEGTSIDSGSPVQFGADNVPIEVYTNEPATCKWSRMGQDYETMENIMECATDASEINAQLSYTCTTNLTGIEDNKENNFFFRCKDKPDKPESERNEMAQSYPFMLRGSLELNIIGTGPNGTISGSTDTVQVDLTAETDDGAEEGKAQCFISPEKVETSFALMAETNSHLHKQTLGLTTGDYTYYFKCVDLGGNSAEASASFSVFVDKDAPKVARVYRDNAENALRIVTNEAAECTYSTAAAGCNFNLADGTKMVYTDATKRTDSLLQWSASTIYYIKCKDAYNNQPSPNDCSIVVASV